MRSTGPSPAPRVPDTTILFFVAASRSNEAFLPPVVINNLRFGNEFKTVSGKAVLSLIPTIKW